ncbi:MAG: DMT family transporter [Planctomycetes bacterium]|nr:DMT family transporter [Planctomycetota bacterium]
MTTGAARFAPHALLLLMIVIWGGSFVAAKTALDSLAPFAIVAARFWIAVACLLPFVLRRGAGAELRAVLRPGAVTGVALTIGYLLQFLGMDETSASMGGFLAGLIPLLVALGGWLVFRSRLGRVGLFGFALGITGMLLLVWPVGDAGDGPHDTPRGMVLQVASSIAYAVHILLISRLGRGLPSMAYCFVQLLVITLAATAAVGLDGPVAKAPSFEWSWVLVAAIAYLGFIATALGIATQSVVQPKIPPMHLALLFATQPLFAAIAGWALLGDRMGPMQLAGGATIVAGIVVTSFDRRR